MRGAFAKWMRILSFVFLKPVTAGWLGAWEVSGEAPQHGRGSGIFCCSPSTRATGGCDDRSPHFILFHTVRSIPSLLVFCWLCLVCRHVCVCLAVCMASHLVTPGQRSGQTRFVGRTRHELESLADPLSGTSRRAASGNHTLTSNSLTRLDDPTTAIMLASRFWFSWASWLAVWPRRIVYTPDKRPQTLCVSLDNSSSPAHCCLVACWGPSGQTGLFYANDGETRLDLGLKTSCWGKLIRGNFPPERIRLGIPI